MTIVQSRVNVTTFVPTMPFACNRGSKIGEKLNAILTVIGAPEVVPKDVVTVILFESIVTPEPTASSRTRAFIPLTSVG